MILFSSHVCSHEVVRHWLVCLPTDLDPCAHPVLFIPKCLGLLPPCGASPHPNTCGCNPSDHSGLSPVLFISPLSLLLSFSLLLFLCCIQNPGFSMTCAACSSSFTLRHVSNALVHLIRMCTKPVCSHACAAKPSCFPFGLVVVVGMMMMWWWWCVISSSGNRQEISEATPTALSRYGRDMTQLARQGKLDPLIGRSDELRRCVSQD